MDILEIKKISSKVSHIKSAVVTSTLMVSLGMCTNASAAIMVDSSIVDLGGGDTINVINSISDFDFGGTLYTIQMSELSHADLLAAGGLTFNHDDAEGFRDSLISELVDGGYSGYHFTASPSDSGWTRTSTLNIPDPSTAGTGVGRTSATITNIEAVGGNTNAPYFYPDSVIVSSYDYSGNVANQRVTGAFIAEQITPVPIPAAGYLLGTGLFGFMVAKRRKALKLQES